MIADQEKYWTHSTLGLEMKRRAERLSSKGFEIYCPQRSVLKQCGLIVRKKMQRSYATSYLFVEAIPNWKGKRF